MSAMSEISMTIEELRTAANALISAADSLQRFFSSKDDNEEELLQETRPLTLEDVRDILRVKCEMGFAADIKQMILDLGAVMGMYWLVKHNVKTSWLLLLCIVGGIALSALGILA